MVNLYNLPINELKILYNIISFLKALMKMMRFQLNLIINMQFEINFILSYFKNNYFNTMIKIKYFIRKIVRCSTIIILTYYELQILVKFIKNSKLILTFIKNIK